MTDTIDCIITDWSVIYLCICETKSFYFLT